MTVMRRELPGSTWREFETEVIYRIVAPRVLDRPPLLRRNVRANLSAYNCTTAASSTRSSSYRRVHGREWVPRRGDGSQRNRAANSTQGKVIIDSGISDSLA